jgi:hypothetical protein
MIEVDLLFCGFTSVDKEIVHTVEKQEIPLEGHKSLPFV